MVIKMKINILTENQIKKLIRQEVNKKFEQEIKMLWKRINCLNDEIKVLKYIK